MKRTALFALFACALCNASAIAQQPDCTKISKIITHEVTTKPSDLLAIVSRQTAANPSCACEIVKAAIVATEAYPELVAQIVATAVEAAPDQRKVITTCALAVAPDALNQIQAVMAKLDPESNQSWSLAVGAKGGLGAKAGLGPKGGVGDLQAVPKKQSRFTEKDPLEELLHLLDFPPIQPPILNSTCTPDQFPNVEVLNP